MILTVNIGNTHITIGGYEKDSLKFCGRLHSDIACTADEYAIRLVNLLSLYHVSPAQIEGGILGSVVPALTGQVLAGLRMLCSARILTVGPGLKSGIKLRLDNPAQLGAELLCGVVAALAECPGPLAVISADTAISIMGVNAKQELVGGAILPGPQPLWPLWCKRPPSCPKSISRPRLPPLFWAKTQPPVSRMALYWAPPGCWTAWPTASAPSSAPRRNSMLPAVCPAPSGRPAAPPSITGKLSSPTACTRSGCGTGKAETCRTVLFAFFRGMCYTILHWQMSVHCAIVAQLDRAFGSDPEGQRFESSRSHQIPRNRNVPGDFCFCQESQNHLAKVGSCLIIEVAPVCAGKALGLGK